MEYHFRLMAVFGFYSGYWPQNSSPCKSLSPYESKGIPESETDRISSLKIKLLVKSYSTEDLVKLCEKLDVKFWKPIVVVTILKCSLIHRASFIPASPDSPQILYIKRGQEGESPSEDLVYEPFIPNYPCLLPTEPIHRVFFLSQMTSQELLQSFDFGIASVLIFCQKDETTKGIALTIGTPSQTFLWLK